jgi:hypothetical protein
VEQVLDTVVLLARDALDVERPAVHLVTSARAGTSQHEAADDAWAQQGDLLRDHAAQLVAQKVDLLDPERIEEGDRVPAPSG